MKLVLKMLWSRCHLLLFRLGFVGSPFAPDEGLDMREDLQVVWRNPTPPPSQKAQLSKGWTGDRLAIYPNGRQVWFEDVSGGHALADTLSSPRILPDDDVPVT